MRDGVLFAYGDSLNARVFGSKLAKLKLPLSAESSEVLDFVQHDADKIASKILSGRGKNNIKN